MADNTSDVKMVEENMDKGPYDPDLHHEYIIKEEEGEEREDEETEYLVKEEGMETELKMEEGIQSQGNLTKNFVTFSFTIFSPWGVDSTHLCLFRITMKPFYLAS